MSTRPDTRPLATVLQRAPEPAPPDRYTQAVRRRRRRRIMLASVLGLALTVALAVWEVQSAAAHYERGRQALAGEQYYAALQELSAARILVFSYRDADVLAAKAREALDDGVAQAMRDARLEDAVRRSVERAGALLTKGEAADVERLLADARARVPYGPLSGDVYTLALLESLARRLTKATSGAVADGRWGTAATYAGALLAIDPEGAPARRLKERAQLGGVLQRRLDDARAAARRREWRRALRGATSVLAAWPGFPGAAALAGEARAALAPKPTPSPTVSAVTATPRPTPPAPSTPTPPPP